MLPPHASQAKNAHTHTHSTPYHTGICHSAPQTHPCAQQARAVPRLLMRPEPTGCHVQIAHPAAQQFYMHASNTTKQGANTCRLAPKALPLVGEQGLTADMQHGMSTRTAAINKSTGVQPPTSSYRVCLQHPPPFKLTGTAHHQLRTLAEHNVPAQGYSHRRACTHSACQGAVSGAPCSLRAACMHHMLVSSAAVHAARCQAHQLCCLYGRRLPSSSIKQTQTVRKSK